MGHLHDRQSAEIANYFGYEVEFASTADSAYRARWDDLVIPAASVNPVGIASAMTVVTDTTGYLGGLEAAASGTPTCVFQWQLPHSLKRGTDIKPHVHYVQLSSGEVQFQASFKHVPVNGIASAWTTMEVGSRDLTGDDTSDRGCLTSWTLDDDTYHFNISDLLLMTLQRTTAGNTSTGSAVVLSGDIHCQRVRLGSINEGSLP